MHCYAQGHAEFYKILYNTTVIVTLYNTSVIVTHHDGSDGSSPVGSNSNMQQHILEIVNNSDNMVTSQQNPEALRHEQAGADAYLEGSPAVGMSHRSWLHCSCHTAPGKWLL